jgi:AcrR family transcriptional regulator
MSRFGVVTLTRPYRGVPADQRRADRRERLVAAGIEVIGTAGWQRTTVRAVCARAALTERYFYESFDDREALLIAVFDSVTAEAAQAILAAVASAPQDAEPRARAAIGAFVDLVAADRNRARVVLVEATGSDALDARRRDAIGAFARLVRDQAAEFYGVRRGSRLKDAELTAHALVGAVAQLLTAWLSGELDVSKRRLVDHCTALFVTASGISSSPRVSPSTGPARSATATR